MTNLGEHRGDRKNLGAIRFIVLLLAVIALMVVFQIVERLGHVAALVVIVCASLLLAALAWLRQD